MDILQLLKETGMIDQIKNQYGLDEQAISSVIQSSMPEIESAIQDNTSSEEGYNSFMNAISDHEKRDLNGMVNNLGNIDINDGSKIIDHIFGNRRDSVQERAAKSAGISSANTAQILAILAPILLSILGKAAKNKKIIRQDKGYEDDFSRNQPRYDDDFSRTQPRYDDDFSRNQRNQPRYGDDFSRNQGRYDDDFSRGQTKTYVNPFDKMRQQGRRPEEPQQRGQGDNTILTDLIKNVLGGNSKKSSKGSGLDMGSILSEILRK